MTQGTGNREQGTGNREKKNDKKRGKNVLFLQFMEFIFFYCRNKSLA